MAKAPTVRATRRSAPARVATPRHIAQLLVALAAPRPDDLICDPAAGACELLVAAAEWVSASFPAMMRDAGEQEHFRTRMFNAFGADKATPRSGMRALRWNHRVDAANLSEKDVLARELGSHRGRYSLVMTRVPCEGRREAGRAKDLPRFVRTTRPELLLLARTLQLLNVGGRAAMIVPQRLLSGATKAHEQLRSVLVDAHRVEAVIALPPAVFLPHSDEPTAILLFSRTDQGGTGHVWFYDLAADGLSLDDARAPLLPDEQLGLAPGAPLTPEEHERNNLPDVVARWRTIRSAAGLTSELVRGRSAQSFCVPRAEIAAQGYDLGIRRYQVLAPERIEARRPHEILAELAGIEAQIFQGMKDLVGMLK
jgi:type I restriction enzyme M protein